MQNTLQIFVNDALTPSEQTRLEACETRITAGLETFMEVGQALLEIRDSRLYRQDHATFEDYCRDRWQMSKRYANYLVQATEITANLGTIVPILPTHEGQVRPLARLEPEQQRTAWEAAVATADTLKEAVTAAIVAAAVNVVKDTPQATEPAIQEIFTTDNDELVHAVIQEYQTQKVKEKPAKQPAKPRTTLPDTGPLSPTEGYRGPTSKAEVNANWIWGRMQDFERDGYLDMGARTIFDHMHPHQKLTIARLIKPILQFFHELETFL